MNTHTVLGVFFILILVYLLVKNATNTSQVIQSLSGGVTSVTATLQGNSPGTSLGTSLIPGM